MFSNTWCSLWFPLGWHCQGVGHLTALFYSGHLWVLHIGTFVLHWFLYGWYTLQLISCDPLSSFHPNSCPSGCISSLILPASPCSGRPPSRVGLSRYFNMHSIVSSRLTKTRPFMVHHAENRQAAPSAISVFTCPLGQLPAGSCLQKQSVAGCGLCSTMSSSLQGPMSVSPLVKGEESSDLYS